MKNIKLVLSALVLSIVFFASAAAQTNDKNTPAEDTEIISPDVIYNDYIDQGLVYLKNNQLNKAKYLFNNARELLPDKPDSYINLAAISMKRKNFENAITLLEKSLKLTDRSRQDIVFCNLGTCFNKLSKYKEATDYYNKAISLNPNLGDALLNLGMLYLKEGKEDSALIDILKARVIFRDKGLKDIVRICDEAILTILENHKTDRKLAEILLLEGSASFENKRDEEAIALLKISLLLYPGSEETCYRLGVVYTSLRKFDEALQCFNETVKLNPKNVRAYMNMGAILGETKKYSEALIPLQKALSLEKNNPKIYYNIAMVYAGNAEKKKAASYLKKAKSLALKKEDRKLLQKIDEAYKSL